VASISPLAPQRLYTGELCLDMEVYHCIAKLPLAQRLRRAGFALFIYWMVRISPQ